MNKNNKEIQHFNNQLSELPKGSPGYYVHKGILAYLKYKAEGEA